jgi:hypothetical protein
VLSRSPRVVSAVGRSSSRGEKERVMVTSGAVRRRPMGGSGRMHREGERDKKEALKVRLGFNKENNHCDRAGLSVAIEPTSSGGSK